MSFSSTEYDNSVEFAQTKAQLIKDLAPEYNHSGAKIFEIGCANGLLTYYLQEVFFEAVVEGGDSAAVEVANARENFPDITFHSLENDTFDFPDNSFDCVVASLLVHHLDLDYQEYLYQNIHRTLRPGGALIILEMNPRPWLVKNVSTSECSYLFPYEIKRYMDCFSQADLFFVMTCYPKLAWLVNFLKKISSSVGLGDIFLIKALK